MSENEIMFAVGNTAYPKEPHFFTVTSDHSIYLLNDAHLRYEHEKYQNVDGAVKGVIVLLKEWFPAKQL